ncbi:MAG TPA: GNAT family N-acetyltransferase [Terriglobia bacterium]|nr:GNAT family N-acetyltransferase [Terriglobia bacterium]
MGSRVVDVRQLRAQQFHPLLRAESRAWLEDLHWDYAPSAELISAFLEEKRLSGFAVAEEDCAKGYCLYFREGSKGLIGSLFVDPVGSRADRAVALLSKTIDALVSLVDVRRIEAQLPHFSLDEIGPYFRSRAFQIYLRQFMTFHLGARSENRRPSPLQPGAARPTAMRSGDFLFEPWERKHDHEAALLLHHVYRNHIDAAVNDQYGTVAGTMRLVESIVRHRGCGDYLQHASIAAIHRSTGRLAGILGLTAVRPGTAHIPQIAVATGFQGLGLGSAMLRSSVEKLARGEFSEVSLTVTTLNSGAARLYERLGFRTFREFGAFVWNRS